MPLQVVRNAMDPLDCVTSHDQSVMRSQPSISCSHSNAAYVRLKFVSMLCLTVWGVGIPLLFAFVLWYYRKEIDTDQVRCP